MRRLLLHFCAKRLNRGRVSEIISHKSLTSGNFLVLFLWPQELIKISNLMETIRFNCFLNKLKFCRHNASYFFSNQ